MLQHKSLSSLQEILFQTTVRYLTVKSQGIEVSDGQPPLPAIEVRILGHGGARTLYRGRRPLCRSLDGMTALRDPEKLCTACEDRSNCTPQVRVDLLFDVRPFRLLLSFTSARNFLEYMAAAKVRGRDLTALRTRISVTPRGSWGELRFHEVQDPSPSARGLAATPADQP